MINQFIKEYRFLSNFYPCEIKWKNIIYPSVENAFQAEKSEDINYKKRCASCSPSQAKRFGRSVNINKKAWEDKKIQVMKELLYSKFSQKSFKEKLLATGDKVLQEGNFHNDVFWGVSLTTGVGKNMLGKLLMEIRNEFSIKE